MEPGSLFRRQLVQIAGRPTARVAPVIEWYMTLLTEIPTAEALATKALRDPEALHRRLAHWNHKRMSAGLPSEAWMEDLREEHEMRVLEGAWVESFRREIASEIEAVPTD